MRTSTRRRWPRPARLVLWWLWGAWTAWAVLVAAFPKSIGGIREPMGLEFLGLMLAVFWLPFVGGASFLLRRLAERDEAAALAERPSA